MGIRRSGFNLFALGPISSGRYPAESVNGRIEARLSRFAQLQREFSKPTDALAAADLPR